MRLVSVRIHEAPGLPNGVVLDGLGPGVQVVVGPNASGKSTVARLVRAALWSAPVDPSVRAEMDFELDGELRRARLAGGVVRWTPGPPPALPEDSERYALGLAELLSATATDQRLARQIAVELAGGDDPGAALAQLGEPGWRQTGPARLLRDATAALRGAEANAENLAADETRLAALAETIAAAEAAERQAAIIDLAREAIAAEDEQAAAEEALAALPTGLEHLAADAGEQVDRAIAALAGARDAMLRARTEYKAAEHDAAAAALPGVDDATLHGGELDASLERAATAMARAGRLREEAERAGRAAAAHEATARRLAGGLWHVEKVEALLRSTPSTELLTERDAEDLAAAADALEGAEAAMAAAEERVRVWAAERERSGATVEEADAQAVVDALRRWQRATASEAASGRRPPPVALFAMVAMVLVIAAVAMVTSTAWLGSMAGVALGAIGAWWWLTRRRPTIDPASLAEEATQRGAAPASWTEAAVEAEIGRWLQLRAQAKLAAVAALRRDEALDGRNAAAAAREQCLAARDACAQRLGLEPNAALLRGRALGERVVALHRAVAARDAADAEAADARAAGQAAEGEVRAALAGFGLGAEATVTTTRQRLEQARKAARQLRDAASALARARDQQQSTADAVEQAWRRAGVTPAPSGLAVAEARAALQERTHALAAFRLARDNTVAASQRAARALAQLRERTAESGAAGTHVQGLFDPAWLAGEAGSGRPERTALDRAANAIREAMDAGAAAREERGALRERLDAASRGRTLSDALAAQADAREAAIAARDEATTVELARWLLERARDEAAEAATPPTLVRARAWFGRFTHEAFGLTIAPSGALAARDNRTGGGLSLAALSDATRVHLLLSLRLAALETGERGAGGGVGCEPLPICLDEVLSTTDAGRFEAVTAALTELGRAGRQVLYLTADAAEAASLRASSTGAADGRDLPTIHWLTGAAAQPLAALPEPVAAPDQRRPDEPIDAWLARLPVPPIDPWGEVDAVHLAWLLDDHPEALARLIAARLDKVGPWRRADAAGRALASLPESIGLALRARVAALEATLQAWRHGRSRPVAWQQLVDSKAISATFLDQAREIWEAGPDPIRVIDAIGALPRFRSANRDRLYEHLVETGALAVGEPLDGDVIERRAIEAATQVGGRVVVGDVGSFVRRWRGALA